MPKQPLTESDLRPGLLVRDGRTIYTVSNVHDDWFTARLDYPVPPRTTVRSFAFHDLVRFAHATEADAAKVAAAYA